MKQSARSEEKIFSVGEFLGFLNELLSPQKAIVQGEIGEISHLDRYTFFKLCDKNEEAVLNCFIWQNTLGNIGVELKEGLEIKVAGFPKIHKPRGRLSFQVEQINLVGEGALKIAFEKLKSRLERLGYFAAERKRPIPPFVAAIGLITSQFADAKTDFLEHLGNFGFKIYFLDVRVEGIYATDEIVAAVKHFNESIPDVDVLVLTRGGGSLESLQAFNTEATAKAIFSSRIPIITGIGHEADVTIADLVADVRASTPTHAARILSDPWKQASREIKTIQNDMVRNLQRTIQGHQEKLGEIRTDILESFRRAQIASKQNLDRLTRDLVTSFGQGLNVTKRLLQEQREKLELASPLKRLKQGYSIVRLGNKIIHSINQLKINDIINIRLFKGEALSQVKEVRGGEGE